MKVRIFRLRQSRLTTRELSRSPFGAAAATSATLLCYPIRAPRAHHSDAIAVDPLVDGRRRRRVEEGQRVVDRRGAAREITMDGAKEPGGHGRVEQVEEAFPEAVDVEQHDGLGV